MDALPLQCVCCGSQESVMQSNDAFFADCPVCKECHDDGTLLEWLKGQFTEAAPLMGLINVGGDKWAEPGEFEI